jgi:DNA-binding CsgD family transcriptional regulator
MALRAQDLQATLDALCDVAERCRGIASLADGAVAGLARLAAADLTTLSICDLATGHRAVLGGRRGVLSPRHLEIFDRYFHEHPLVRHHGRNPHARTRQVADLLPRAEFRESALFNDYYRPIRIDEVVAVPVHVDERLLVSFVMQRQGRPFDARELARLEVARPMLASLFRMARALDAAREAAERPPCCAGTPLTPREREVLRWVAAGKTNRDVADILGASPRTVAKHLERVYVKLGVESRTAAAMRLMR